MSEARFKALEENLVSALGSIGAPTDDSDKIGDALDILYELMEDYERTVEMSPGQYSWLEENKDEIVYAVGDFDDIDYDIRTSFDRDFWYPLTQRDVVYAWLHPERVVMVEDDADYSEETHGD